MNQYWKRLHELADEIGIQETLEILERVHELSASDGSLLAECLEILEDVLHETVNASSYPDGQNLDRLIRKRIKETLEKAANVKTSNH